jgi:membrane protein
MRSFLQCILRAVARLFPACTTQAQAVAFNMFLAFFPMLLLALGVLNKTALFQTGVQEMVARVREILPPGSHRVVVDFLGQQATHPWRWTLFGLIGTLLAGAQVMRLMMDGFRMVYRDPVRAGFWSREARAAVLLCATIAPWLATVGLMVFGKQLRAWVILHYGLSSVFRWIWGAVLSATALVIAVLVLAVVYRVGRSGVRGWREVLPGAVLATLLWWAANVAFGFYVRHMHYRVVYGGLAAAIGLLLWMQLTTMIVLFGAAFNAEISARGSTDAQHANRPAPGARLGRDAASGRC